MPINRDLPKTQVTPRDHTVPTPPTVSTQTVSTPQTPPVPTSTQTQSTPAATMGQANPFESQTRAEFVEGQSSGAPDGGASALATRLNNATSGNASELARMARLVPGVSVVGAAPAEMLVRLVRARLEEATAKGNDSVELTTGALDTLLQPAWSSGHQGYAAVAEALSKRGYQASSDGFMGVFFRIPASTSAAMDPAAFKAALLEALPAPPAALGMGERLGKLVKGKIDEAIGKGKTQIMLEPNELDPILGNSGGPKYGEIAKELEALGYKARADGFIGISASWQETSKPSSTKEEMLHALDVGVPPPGAGDAVERLVSLIERKLAGAGKDKSIDLEPKELDPILKSALGSSGGGYVVLAEALQARGYSAFADGFMGVSAGWS